MEKSVDLLQLCKGLTRINKKSQLAFVDTLNHKTLHLISEIFYNIQYLTELAPPKIRNKLICGMKKNATECRYISNRRSNASTKKNILKNKLVQVFSH